MANTRDIKRRIKSTKSTGKITGAMELVSASKMKRAIDGAVISRPYTKTLRALAPIISESASVKNSGFHHDDHKLDHKTLIVVVASNRGLCGSYNTQIGRELARYVRSIAVNEHIAYVTIGKKADFLVKRLNGNIVASFHELPEKVNMRSLTPIITYIEKAFETNNYNTVRIFFTEFKTPLFQEVRVHTLLPVQFDQVGEEHFVQNVEYLIEPNPARVLEVLKHRYMSALLYQYIQESRASEHSARMVAMRNAKDAADEMVEELSLEYNKARQAGITREIAEISAGQLVS